MDMVIDTLFCSMQHEYYHEMRINCKF